jgi:uncharacterized repeat protein (TIGR03803 family)
MHDFNPRPACDGYQRRIRIPFLKLASARGSDRIVTGADLVSGGKLMIISRSLLPMAVAAAVFCAGSPSPAQSYKLTTLAVFNGANGFGNDSAIVADANGNIFGTTQFGGAYNRGTVFELDAASHTLTTIATFDGLQGKEPWAGLYLDGDGNLYGTTLFGGNSNNGTIYRVAVGTHTFSTLASFDGANGSYPLGGLSADSDGNLYGAAGGGGDLTLNAGRGFGTVYELPLGANVITKLATFNGSNGSFPYSRLIADANGNLYGTTSQGGFDDWGTVFELEASTHTITPLASVATANGRRPFAGLTADAEGNLFGTTAGGGSLAGDVFKVSAVTHDFGELATFDLTTGQYPYLGPLIIDADGNLFGTTQQGGANRNGTVFRIDAVTRQITTLIAFDNTHGAYPYAGLIADTHGNFYGTTFYGGDLTLNGGLGYGTIFELSPVPEPSTIALSLLAVVVLSIFCQAKNSVVTNGNRCRGSGKQHMWAAYLFSAIRRKAIGF